MVNKLIPPNNKRIYIYVRHTQVWGINTFAVKHNGNNILAENIYCKLPNTRRTKSQNLNNYRLVLQLSYSNQLKSGVR